MENIQEQLKYHIEEVREAIIANDAPSAFRLARELTNYVKQKGFKRSNTDLFQRYMEIIAKLKWVGLPLFSHDDVMALFEKNFQEALDIPLFNLRDKVFSAMAHILTLEERDQWKKDIREIINRNKALLTKTNLKNKKRGTVENWIKNYVSEIGLKKAESIKFENYFTSNENVILLPPEEKNLLKDFLFFYEYLKTSSLSPEGLEDRPLISDSKDSYILGEGTAEPVRVTKMQEKISRIVEEVLSGKKPVKAQEPKPEAEEISAQPASQESAPKEKKPEPEEEKDPRILELEKEIKAYPDGSLERKMIEQEIKKIKKTKT